ncbi:MAG: hypothetical protein C9356_12395 [Oleiphilus sp.]|nr:MAG: hypothetical protein C9356_12395 [Oleiphilus sp.]
MSIDPKKINPDILPELHRELASVIGLPATLKLGEAYNGVRLYVPNEAHADHDVVKIIGMEAFEALVDAYRSEELSFPKLDAAVRQIKYRLIAEMTAARVPSRDIALNTGYTQRRVQQIRAELGINSSDIDQLTMF